MSKLAEEDQQARNLSMTLVFQMSGMDPTIAMLALMYALARMSVDHRNEGVSDKDAGATFGRMMPGMMQEMRAMSKAVDLLNAKPYGGVQ